MSIKESHRRGATDRAAVIIHHPVIAMHEDIAGILIPQPRIASRVAQLAQQITRDHITVAAEVPEITIIPIMTGAMIFCGDLIRHMPLAMCVRLMTVSSYPGSAVTSAGSVLKDQELGDLRGRHLLLVDDILDSGGTLRLVVPLLRSHEPASLRTCVLLRKDRPAARQVPVDYVGFDIPDEFVVGYGLDYNGWYRNLPDIVTLTPEAIRRRH